MGAVLALVVVIAVAVIGGRALGKARERAEANRAARSEAERTVTEQRDKMVDSLKKGDASAGMDAVGQMRGQLERSASTMKGEDAAAMKAMAEVLRKIEVPGKGYAAAIARMKDAEVLQFKIREQATFEKHREIVREFLARNDDLATAVANTETITRETMKEAGISQAKIDATVAGMARGEALTRRLKSKIRAADKTIGESALGVLDQLEANWGKWKFDETAGHLVFKDSELLAAHNVLVGKIQDAGELQTKAQEKLVEVLRDVKTK